MTASAFASQVTDLARLSGQEGRRTLSEQTGVDFSSNDYLGLARGLIGEKRTQRGSHRRDPSKPK